MNSRVRYCQVGFLLYSVTPSKWRKTDDRSLSLAPKRFQANGGQVLHELNFRVIAVGDSYNDTSMLSKRTRYSVRAPESVCGNFAFFRILRATTSYTRGFSRALTNQKKHGELVGFA